MTMTSSRNRPLLLRLVALLCLLPAATLVHAQEEATTSGYQPASEPVEMWRAKSGNILDDNGVYITPDDRLVIATTQSASVYAFDSFTGDERWVYTPIGQPGQTIRCISGMTFHYTPESKFMVYSVVENPNSEMAQTKVIALNPFGQPLWQSMPLEGINSGSPQISSDGKLVFLTHNSGMHQIGHFTVLDASEIQAGGLVLPKYTEFNKTNPFSPPGIFHNPAEGYYDGGETNNNDILLWSFAPKPLDETVGIGSAFAFQMPVDPEESAYWTLLGDAPKDWQSISAPAITNEGRSLYWSVSRSQFRAWVGESGRNQYRFNRGRTKSPGFRRGLPRGQASFNTPALSSNPISPMVFAASASTQFIKFDHMMTPLAVYNTTTLVKNKAHVTPGDEFVFFTEFGGTFHMAYTSTLTDHMVISQFGALEGDFAMRSDGAVVYIGEVSGTVRAIRVGESQTAAPTSAPTAAPIVQGLPVPVATDAPTSAPTLVPTSGKPVPATPPPTMAPTNAPTNATADITSNTTAPSPAVDADEDTGIDGGDEPSGATTMMTGTTLSTIMLAAGLPTICMLILQ